MSGEKKRSRKKIIITFAFILLILAGIGITLKILTSSNNNHQNPYTPPPYERVYLSYFPVSLDDLFKTNNPTQQLNQLNAILHGRPEASGLFMEPYPNYFHHGHSPGAMKWYLYVGKHSPIRFSVDTYLTLLDWNPLNYETINGSLIAINVGATFAFSYYQRVALGHVGINVTLKNAYDTNSTNIYDGYTKGLFIPKDTIIGFTDNSTALDFVMIDDTVFNFGPGITEGPLVNPVNPYWYFTSSARSEIDSYFSIQYNKERESGLYPDANVNRTSYDINTNHSIFGSWFYKAGWFELNSSHHLTGWYSFDGSILNILNVNKTSRDTFYNDANTGLLFNSSMVGVFYDSKYVPVENYTRLGGNYMYYEQGDNNSGIIQLTQFFDVNRPSPKYLKYQFIEGNYSSMYDDSIMVQYFDSLSAAQSSFTNLNITYSRVLDPSLG
jgi:hypothetical protein